MSCFLTAVDIPNDPVKNGSTASILNLKYKYHYTSKENLLELNLWSQKWILSLDQIRS